MVNVIIITRGNLGEKILETTISLLGNQEYVNISAYSILPDSDPEILKELILNKIHNWDNKEGVLITTGMCGGTACNIALSVLKELEKENIKCEIISGLNLYMMVSILTKRNNLSIEDLVQQAINDGRKSITDVKSYFLQKKGENNNE